MNDDELKQLWQQQTLRQPTLSTADLLAAMQVQSSQFRRILRARDLRELIACAIVGLIFGYFYFFSHAHQPMVRLGDLIVVGGALYIAWKLVSTSRAHPPAAPGATTVESIRAELTSVRAQSHLLNTVHIWYLSPIALGLAVSTWGSGSPLAFKIIYSIFVLALFAFIYWLNQWARTKQILPLQAQLESLLHSAETGAPISDQQTTTLRPIALSLASADKVKPIEFKVAFWPIAFFSEIGFIGIWFFFMLGQALDNPKSEAPLPPPAALRPEETTRYSTAARQIVDLLNAQDYSAIQNRFTPGMTAVLPPHEAPEFFNKLAARYGRIHDLTGPISNGYQDWTAFHLQGQSRQAIMSLALSTNNQIAGLHFRPAPTPNPTFSSVTRELFSWQRLIWLPVFFLAGLAFARLLQNGTARAVGISPLGLHLAKGQQLILWDEITEVRPFRLLHIRSLYLIQPAAPKTLMPWTSLENHHTLKSVIDQHAPPNHPIRQYLPLLKVR